jgi:hypothetical protein
MADDPVVIQQQEGFLADSALLTTLRNGAIGTGTFASAAIRDATIRACCRVALIYLRNRTGKNDQAD